MIPRSRPLKTLVPQTRSLNHRLNTSAPTKPTNHSKEGRRTTTRRRRIKMKKKSNKDQTKNDTVTDQETWWPAPYCQRLSLKWGYQSDSHWPGWDAVAFVLSLSLSRCSVQLYDHLMRLSHSTAYGGGCKVPPPKKKTTTISLDVDTWHREPPRHHPSHRYEPTYDHTVETGMLFRQLTGGSRLFQYWLFEGNGLLQS